MVRLFHTFNKERKELYVILKYSNDGKKIILDEKGPIKKKNLKTYVEKSKYFEFFLKKIGDQIPKFIFPFD